MQHFLQIYSKNMLSQMQKGAFHPAHLFSYRINLQTISLNSVGFSMLMPPMLSFMKETGAAFLFSRSPLVTMLSGIFRGRDTVDLAEIGNKMGIIPKSCIAEGGRCP